MIQISNLMGRNFVSLDQQHVFQVTSGGIMDAKDWLSAQSASCPKIVPSSLVKVCNIYIGTSREVTLVLLCFIFNIEKKGLWCLGLLLGIFARSWEHERSKQLNQEDMFFLQGEHLLLGFPKTRQRVFTIQHENRTMLLGLFNIQWMKGRFAADANLSFW